MSSSQTGHYCGEIDVRGSIISLSKTADKASPPGTGVSEEAKPAGDSFILGGVIDSTIRGHFLINSCHDKGVRDRNPAGIEATDRGIGMMLGNQTGRDFS
eukprot:gene26155-biopygen14451